MHVKVRLQPTGAGFRLEAQRMLRPTGYPVVDVGAKMQDTSVYALLGLHLDGKERRIFDLEAAFLDRRDQEILVALALEHGREQLDESRAADRSFEVEPGPVGGDAHVQVAENGGFQRSTGGGPLAATRDTAPV